MSEKEVNTKENEMQETVLKAMKTVVDDIVNDINTAVEAGGVWNCKQKPGSLDFTMTANGIAYRISKVSIQ